MRRLITISALWGLVLAAAPALAEPAPSTPPSARKMELARRYVLLLDRDLPKTRSEAFTSFVPELLDDEGKVRPEQQAVFDQVVDETRAHLRAKLHASITKGVAELFSEEELEGIVAFQESAAGEAMRRKMPAVFGLYMDAQVGFPQEARVFSRRSLCAKIRCENPPD